MKPSPLMSARVGINPTTELKAAGCWMDPHQSLPVPAAANPAAIAAAVPPLEPPVTRNLGLPAKPEPVGDDDLLYAPHLYTVTGGLDTIPYNGDRARVDADYELAVHESRLNKLSGESVSGDLRIDAALADGGEIGLKTVSGDVRLRLPRGLSAVVRGESFSGDLRAPDAQIQRPKHGPGASFEHRYGSGSGRVRLETFSGDETLELRLCPLAIFVEIDAGQLAIPHHDLAIDDRRLKIAAVAAQHHGLDRVDDLAKLECRKVEQCHIGFRAHRESATAVFECSIVPFHSNTRTPAVRSGR